jgi:integrase
MTDVSETGKRAAGKIREIDTTAKRDKLPTRKNPYWQGISGGRGGVSLGYRKGAAGGGVWIVKIVIDRKRTEERIGPAADQEDAPVGFLSYTAAVSAALEWSRTQIAIVEANADVARDAAVPTVRSVVEAYAARRKKAAGGKQTSVEALLSHLPIDGKFAKLRFAKLTEKAIEEWLGQLQRRPKGIPNPKRKGKKVVVDVRPLETGTRNRLLGDLRAAFNIAAGRYRREIPGHIHAEIKAGTRNEPTDGEARRQLLSEAQVRTIVDAAFDVEEDLGYVVLIAAVTGARYSQIVRLTVADIQVVNSRIMVPSSKKGRKKSSHPPAAVPVHADAIDRLKVLVVGRAGNDRLLTRWAYKHGAGRWLKDKRRAWGLASEITKPWARVVKLAGVPEDTIMYALRHTSIVRGLIAGLPVRLIAALHDTSVAMIEQHYSAFITDMSDELARPHAISFEGPKLAQAAE